MALTDYEQPAGLEELAPEFSALLVESFNSQDRMPVSRLFNEWWRFSSPHAREAYRRKVRATPGFMDVYGERYIAPMLDPEVLAAMPEGTLGRAYGDFIVANDLAPQLAINYRERHDQMVAAGHLDAMPDELKYAILRGFQVHDFMHVVTGYRAAKTGEQAVLAFCLAQWNFPYFAMWMSVTTTRMALIDPTMIEPLMDAITDGWQAGRRASNIQWLKFEERLDQPLADLREEFAIRTAECPAARGSIRKAA
jgi:ubiquinone biosynthesis protein COQ4